MIRDIQISDISDNPFQARKHFDRDQTRSLADEIKAEGFWNTTLQARKTKPNGKVELVFGHRRLRALRLLGVKSVKVEVLDLTDAQMALRSLEENFQREGLTDLEKADGVRAAVEQLEKAGVKRAAKVVAERLNLGESWVSELVQISAMAEMPRKSVTAGYLSAKTAFKARQFGGDAFVETLAARGKAFADSGEGSKPTHKTVEAFAREIKKLADPAIAEKVKARVISGDIANPADVAGRARALASTRAARSTLPPKDLREVIVGWTHEFKDWSKRLKEVRPYMEYIEEIPSLARDFRAAAEDLARALRDL